jgi:hypothetical protein
MRLARFLLLLVFAALFVAGCGSSDDESDTAKPSTQPPAATSNAPPGAAVENCRSTTVAGTSQLHVTGVDCQVGRGIVASWAEGKACASNSSHPACTVYRGYRCIASRTDAGLSVNCALPGRSISFLAKPR